MPFIAVIVLILVVAVVAGLMRSPSPPAPRIDVPPRDQDDVAADEGPAALALDDPLEALLRYGTPADAARLADQGVDLAALGYRPPQAH